MKQKPKPYKTEDLKNQILADAKSLKIPQKWAEKIANETAKHVDSWTKNRSTVTEADITRVSHQKLKELNPDLAYIYKNRGKIL